MQNYAPRPRPPKMFTLSTLPVLIFFAITLAGIAFTDFDGDRGGTIGMVIGALIGGGAAAIFAPRFQRRKRRDDEERLATDLED